MEMRRECTPRPGAGGSGREGCALGTKARGATSLSLLSVTLYLLPFGRSKEGAGRSRGDGGLFIGVSSKKEKAELSLGKMSGEVADDG